MTIEPATFAVICGLAGACVGWFLCWVFMDRRLRQAYTERDRAIDMQATLRGIPAVTATSQRDRQLERQSHEEFEEKMKRQNAELFVTEIGEDPDDLDPAAPIGVDITEPKS